MNSTTNNTSFEGFNKKLLELERIGKVGQSQIFCCFFDGFWFFSSDLECFVEDHSWIWAMVKIWWTALYFKNQPENTDLKIALRLALEEMTNLS